MLRVSERAKQLRLNTAHKIFYNQAPEYLQENFKKDRNRQQQHTRSRLWNFIVPNVKGNESNSFFFHTISDWNSLPNESKRLVRHDLLLRNPCWYSDISLFILRNPTILFLMIFSNTLIKTEVRLIGR